MGGFFGIASKKGCITDLYYGTDYHSHLGTKRGGLAAFGEGGFCRHIHNIENTQFRSKFEVDIERMKGTTGIGVISDTDDQPLIIGSHLGTYGIVTVGKISNMDELTQAAFRNRTTHFCEMSQGQINQTEVVATIINKGATFEEGIALAQNTIQGSCSMLLLTNKGIYAARDKLGRTPVILGAKAGTCAVTMETCAFPNLEIEYLRDLGPGEIVFITPDGVEQRRPPGDKMQICSFLWVYFGYPSSEYEGISVEACRNRCGAALARNDDVEIDIVAGIPDSGTAHAIGYAHQRGVPYRRPFIKYTPTWPRSFMPQDQQMRDLVARMKLTPVREIIRGMRILFCEDSIVRGTQLKGTIRRLFDYGAKEVHMRPACPPLLHGCKFLNFSRSRSEMDLAARRAIHALEKIETEVPPQYMDCRTEQFHAMVEQIRCELGLTSLKYQRLDDLVEAIGLPKERLCTHCWDGSSYF